MAQVLGGRLAVGQRRAAGRGLLGACAARASKSAAARPVRAAVSAANGTLPTEPTIRRAAGDVGSRGRVSMAVTVTAGRSVT